MAGRALILPVLACAAGLAAGGAAALPEISWDESAAGGEARVCGLPAAALAAADAAGLASALEVRAFDAAAGKTGAADDLPALWGSHQVEDGCLVFRPRHRPAPGMTLLATFRGEIFDRLAVSAGTPNRGTPNRGTPNRGTPDRELQIELSAAEAATRVAEIWPTGDIIPENQLRLYVAFSGQMSLKGIEKHLHLRDAAGNEIADAFVDIPGGLWDPSRRRLTLILHPGRVKSGIAIGERMGKILEAGQEIRLEIDRQALDAEGAPLIEGATRAWTIGKPQKDPLDPKQFRLRVGQGERAPLEIEAPVPLDRAIALSAFTVLQGENEIAGTLEIEAGDRRLRFHPAEPWHRGQPHLLRIGAELEDAAGNRLGRAFETPADSPAQAAPIDLPFTP